MRNTSTPKIIYTFTVHENVANIAAQNVANAAAKTPQTQPPTQIELAFNKSAIRGWGEQRKASHGQRKPARGVDRRVGLIQD